MFKPSDRDSTWHSLQEQAEGTAGEAGRICRRVHIENARHEGNDLRGLGRVLELVNKEVNVVLRERVKTGTLNHFVILSIAKNLNA